MDLSNYLAYKEYKEYHFKIKGIGTGNEAVV